VINKSDMIFWVFYGKYGSRGTRGASRKLKNATFGPLL
jgi:hypothetical protein